MNLKPCPICGKTPVLSEAGEYPRDYKFFCGTHVSCGNWFPNTLGAARDWNRRTTDTNQPDLHKTTNADCIRNMSDEELAVVIMCPNEAFSVGVDCNNDKKCRQCCLKWLRQPAED